MDPSGWIAVLAGGGLITILAGIIGALCTLVPMIIGFVFLFQWGKQVTDTVNAPNRAPNNWPWVRGSVMASELGTQNGQPAPIVTYEYQVGGVPYQSQTIRYGRRKIGPQEAPGIVTRYRPGTEVMVYYNPANPAEAVLQRE